MDVSKTDWHAAMVDEKNRFLKEFHSKEEALRFELAYGWVADGKTGAPYFTALLKAIRNIKSGREID